MVNQTSSFKACPQCQTPAQIDAPYCGRCGHQFQTQFGNYQQPPASYYRPNPNWGLGYGAQPDSNKLLITILLWFFLGHFGAHRFYLGHTSTAVTMLILEFVGLATICLIVGYFVLLGIAVWWIVDLVMMLTGQLRPVDGSRLV
jgi:TM2 domain-containing membrane protein YozV